VLYRYVDILYIAKACKGSQVSHFENSLLHNRYFSKQEYAVTVGELARLNRLTNLSTYGGKDVRWYVAEVVYPVLQQGVTLPACR